MAQKKQQPNSWTMGRRFGKVPVDVVANLSNAELRTYVLIAAVVDNDGIGWCVQSKLAEESGVTPRALRKTIKSLKAKGVLQELKRGANTGAGGNRGATYKLTMWVNRVEPQVPTTDDLDANRLEPQVPTALEPQVPQGLEPHVPPIRPTSEPYLYNTQNKSDDGGCTLCSTCKTTLIKVGDKSFCPQCDRPD